MEFLKSLVLFSVFIFCSVYANDLFSIEGKITVSQHLAFGHDDWLENANVYVDGGRYIGVPRYGSIQSNY